MNEARRLIEDRESLWSTTREIYKANHSGGQMITVREETADLLNFTPGMAEKQMAHWTLRFIRYLTHRDLRQAANRFLRGIR